MRGFPCHRTAAPATAEAAPDKKVVVFAVALRQRFVALELGLHALKYILCNDRGNAYLDPLISGPIHAAGLPSRFLLVVIHSPDIAFIA
jgi:hypothetical protein